MKTLDAQNLAAVSGGEVSTSTIVTIGVITAVSPLLGLAVAVSYLANARSDC